MPTMPRSLRIPGDLWNAAIAKAAREGTTLTEVVIAALVRYVTEGSSKQSEHID